MPATTRPGCATCLRLRLFLTLAGALIIGLYLQPGWATALAGLMPPSLVIGWAICIGGAIGFSFRLRTHLRKSR